MTSTSASSEVFSEESREAALHFLRARVMPWVFEVQAGLASEPWDERLLAVFTSLGNRLDAMSTQHPALQLTLDGLHRVCVELAHQVLGTSEVSVVQRELPRRLKRAISVLDSSLSEQDLRDWEGIVALLHAALALAFEHEAQDSAGAEFSRRELAPLSGELLAWMFTERLAADLHLKYI